MLRTHYLKWSNSILKSVSQGCDWQSLGQNKEVTIEVFYLRQRRKKLFEKKEENE